MYYKVIHQKTQQQWYGFPDYLAKKIGCKKKEIEAAARQKRILMGCYQVLLVDAKGEISKEEDMRRMVRLTKYPVKFVREFDIDWTNTVQRKRASGINLNIPIVSQESSNHTSFKGGVEKK